MCTIIEELKDKNDWIQADAIKHNGSGMTIDKHKQSEALTSIDTTKKVFDKSQVILIIIMILLPSCAGINQKCEKVQKGTFFQYSKFDGAKIRIDRNDSIQVETNLINGDIQKSRIQWITPCSFLLMPTIKPLGSSYKDKTDSFIQNTTFRINIIDVQKKYYIFTCKIDSIGKSLFVKDSVFLNDN